MSRNDDERHLSRWVQAQRNRHRNGQLTTEVAAVLAAVPGGTWGSGITGPNSTRGDKGLEQLRTWMSTHPYMPRLYRDDRQERRLSDLVSRQRRRYPDDALSAQRIATLESIPGWSWHSATRSFDEVTAQLELWIAEHNRLPSNSTQATTTERRLARWVAGHCLRYRQGAMSPDDAAALSAVPGWTWPPRRSRTASVVGATEHHHSQTTEDAGALLR